MHVDEGLPTGGRNAPTGDCGGHWRHLDLRLLFVNRCDHLTERLAVRAVRSLLSDVHRSISVPAEIMPAAPGPAASSIDSLTFAGEHFGIGQVPDQDVLSATNAALDTPPISGSAVLRPRPRVVRDRAEVLEGETHCEAMERRRLARNPVILSQPLRRDRENTKPRCGCPPDNSRTQADIRISEYRRLDDARVKGQSRVESQFGIHDRIVALRVASARTEEGHHG